MGLPKEKIIAMIPARMGSLRLKMKNLALLDGKPLVYYAVQAAKDVDVFSRIIINSENALFEKISNRYEVGFYKRPAELATSETKSDHVVYDFIKNNSCDVLVWVNPTSPLQTGEDIRQVVDYFFREELDSLITVKEEQVHCIYKGKPINFKYDDIFAQTQDLSPVNPFVYSLMMWRSDIFVRTFEAKGHSFFCGKVGYYPVGKFSSIIIKKKEDLILAEALLKLRNSNESYQILYDRIIHE